MTRPVPWWGRWIVIVLLALAAFAVGRATTPIADEQIAVITVTRERVIEKWRAQKDRIVYTEKTTTTPDGTVTAEKRSEKETERNEAQRETQRDTDQKSITVRDVEQRPNWRVGVQAGASLREPSIPITGPLVIGVSVEARLARTPVSVGVWGNTVGAAGASISVEF